ncbi:MAG TPA: hypothetical protein VKV04_10190 [Verrucomicrobiae bacterium]|nr:hypothetical protein [Verrucomicrobiae bacterium]
MSEVSTSTEAKETTAAELLGETPPPPKTRPPWPPEIPFVEAYKNCGYARHPVDKQFIGFKKACELGCTTFDDTAHKEQSPTPPPPPQPISEPELTPPPPPPSGERGPEFSELPPSDEAERGDAPTAEQPQMSEDELRSMYERIAGYCWDTWVTLFVFLVGDFWQPKSKEERQAVIDAFVFYFKSIAMQAWTPFQTLLAAISMYCIPRMPATVQTLWHKWRNRKAKRQQEEEAPPEEQAPRPQSTINLGPGE